MTEKRFRLGYVCGDFGLIDNDEWIDLHSMSENSKKNVQICINKMNELADENEQLKSALKELKVIGDYQADRIQELGDENKQLHQSVADWETSFDLLKQQLQSEHQMLENAILLERTRMGQNALKQYRDAIQ